MVYVYLSRTFLLSILQVDNTDAEGRLLLADALYYSHSFNPSAVIDLATLTGAIDVALGSGAAAVFTNSPPLWDKLHMVTIFFLEYQLLISVMNRYPGALSMASSPGPLYISKHFSVAHKDGRQRAWG